MSVTILNALSFIEPILKIGLVALFFYRFIRQPTVLAGIGLLTISSAVLLDAASSVFGGGTVANALGYFTPVLLGGLFGGAGTWVWGMLREPIQGKMEVRMPASAHPSSSAHANPAHANPARLRAGNLEQLQTAYDRQMLFDQIRTRFGREDVRDLIFDMGFNENDLIGLGEDMNPVIVRLMESAEAEGLAGQLALSAERILTPPPPNSLPRLEKLDADTPPTILRHYLLATQNLRKLEDIATKLGIDWEQLPGNGKQAKTRELLLHMYRRDRIEPLIEQLIDQTKIK